MLNIVDEEKTISEINYLCIAIGHLYLEGNSYRDIAKMIGVSHITVRNNIIKLEKIDINLYHKVINQVEIRTPDSIKKEHVQERVIKVTESYLKEDKTIDLLAKEFNVTPFIIYRDFILRLPVINNYIENKIPKEKIDKVFEILTNNKMQNLEMRSSKKSKK